MLVRIQKFIVTFALGEGYFVGSCDGELSGKFLEVCGGCVRILRSDWSVPQVVSGIVNMTGDRARTHSRGENFAKLPFKYGILILF